jgi:hypothetical protein
MHDMANQRQKAQEIKSKVMHNMMAMQTSINKQGNI